MFNNQKYITRGVMNEIPLCLQWTLWELVRTMPYPKDYLQVFTLSAENGKQIIVHTQEQPKYEKTHFVNSEGKIVCDKVFVIDDETHSTMLLADEY